MMLILPLKLGGCERNLFDKNLWEPKLNSTSSHKLTGKHTKFQKVIKATTML